MSVPKATTGLSQLRAPTRKTDDVRMRTTPELKAQIEDEAKRRGITVTWLLTELVVRELARSRK